MKKKIIKRKGAAASATKNNIQEIIKQLNSTLGAGTLVLGSEAHLDVSWISTSCYELDFATGGGIPKSRITEIFGVESSGKTTLSLKICNEFLNTHPEGLVIYIDVEKTLEQDYLEALVEDLDRFVIGSPDSGEQVVDIINECAGQPIDLLLIVDSIAATVPMTEVENSADKANVGLHPRLINKLVRIANVRMKKNMSDASAPSTTIILLNQERQKIGVMFGDPSTTPGGLGKNFFSSLRIRLFGSNSASNQIAEKVKVGTQEKSRLIGRKFTYNVVKNKCGVEPFEKGEIYYYNTQHKGFARFSFDNHKALFRWGVLTNAITFEKGEYTWFDPGGNPITYKSEAGFMKAVTANEDWMNQLYYDILEERKTGGLIDGEA